MLYILYLCKFLLLLLLFYIQNSNDITDKMKMDINRKNYEFDMIHTQYIYLKNNATNNT